MQQHRETRRSLDECSDGGTVQAQDEVALPVAGYGAIFNCRGTLADENFGRHEGLTSTARSLPRNAKGSPRAQACGELAVKGPTPLDIQRLVDRFVTDAHRRVLGEIYRQAVRDLLRAPGT